MWKAPGLLLNNVRLLLSQVYHPHVLTVYPWACECDCNLAIVAEDTISLLQELL
jgi:hypothetical protein